MPVFLTPADADTRYLLTEVLQSHDRLRPIVAGGLLIEVLFADAGGPPALKFAGAPTLAILKKVPDEEKAKILTGNTAPPDARLLIDEKRFIRLGYGPRRGLLAREMFRVDVETYTNHEGKSVAKLDAYDRPVFRILPYDYVVFGNTSTALIYGPDSAEVRSYRGLGELLGQQGLPFMSAPSPEAVVTPAEPDGREEVNATFHPEKLAACLRAAEAQEDGDQVEAFVEHFDEVDDEEISPSLTPGQEGAGLAFFPVLAGQTAGQTPKAKPERAAAKTKPRARKAAEA